MWIALTWLFTVLIPINGVILYAIRTERLKNRRLLLELWKSGVLLRRRRRRMN